MEAAYAASDNGVDSTDPVGLSAGDNVAVETTDEWVPCHRTFVTCETDRT